LPSVRGHISEIKQDSCDGNCQEVSITDSVFTFTSFPEPRFGEIFGFQVQDVFTY